MTIGTSFVTTRYWYYEQQGGTASFKDILNRKAADETEQLADPLDGSKTKAKSDEAPMSALRKKLADIFPYGFERQINACIVLDSVQQADFKVRARNSLSFNLKGGVATCDSFANHVIRVLFYATAETKLLRTPLRSMVGYD